MARTASRPSASRRSARALEIASVRQGKYFVIEIADGTPREEAAANLDKIALEVLSNPVIEEYRVEIID